MTFILPKSIVPKKGGKLFHVPNVLYENRYCNQDGFSILICGGKDNNKKYLNIVFEMKVPSFEVCDFPSMINQKAGVRLVVVNSDIMAIGGGVNMSRDLRKVVKPVEIYSNKMKSWQLQYIQIEEKSCFCPCFFLKQMFVIGGWIRSSDETLSSCFIYSFKSDSWSQIADLNVARDSAACTVFEGKIVVSGGGNDYEFKSVEAYDYYEDKWTYLPDMIEERSLHVTVSMGNKMFVIGGYETINCEVFENCSRMFTTINTGLNYPAIDEWYFEAFCIGNCIVVFHHFQCDLKDSIVYLYDVEEEQWSNIDCGFTKNLYGQNFVKYYKQ